MILDSLENVRRYLSVNSRFAKAFEFLLRPDLRELPVGRYDLDQERLYALVAVSPGRGREDGLLETHRRYIDIQHVLSGTDELGWRPAASCHGPSGGYDPEADVQFFTDPPVAWLPAEPGMFAIFFPEDAHLPLISPGQLHKVVVKVAVDQG